MGDAVVVTGLAALAVAYGAGRHRQRGRADAVHLVAFAGALAALLVALLPPMASAAETSLTAHMVQHVLLLVVVPPLLLAGHTGSTVFFALSPAFRQRAAPVVARAARAAHRPPAVGVALLVQVGTMALWHTPSLYDAAASHEALHASEHLALLATSVLLWWTVAANIRHRPAVALGGLFVASAACTALGAAMVLTGQVWYPRYGRLDGSSALADQQLAGVVMWGFGNLVLVVAACTVVATWLARVERTTPNRPVREPAP